MNRICHAVWRFFWKLRAARAKGLQVGDVFPDFTFWDVTGIRHSLSDIFPEKKAVLWFTNFCEDCRSKIPLLEELHKNEGGRFGIYAVSLLGNDLKWPRECASQASFPFLIDPDDLVGREMGLSHPPGTCPLQNFFILDRQGRILFRHHLSALSPDQFRKTWVDFAGL